MARPRGEDGMTKEEKITCITILGVLFLFIFFVEYLFFIQKSEIYLTVMMTAITWLTP